MEQKIDPMEAFEDIENLHDEVSFVTQHLCQDFKVVIEIFKLAQMKELNRNIYNLDITLRELVKK